MLRTLLALLAAVPLVAAADARALAHFRRGLDLASHGELYAAEQEYLAGLSISPDPAAYNNLGVLYFRKQAFEQAVRAFQSAHQMQANDPEIAFNLGLALYKSGRTSEAIPPLTTAVASTHAREAHYLLGASYFSQKQWDKAIAELEPLRHEGAVTPETLFILAQAYRYAGKPADSLEAGAQLLKSDPDSAFTHELLAEAYDKDGQPEKAIDEFQKAIAVSPRSPELHFMLGYVCWRWKRYGQAIAPLEAEIRMNPSYAASYYYLGDIAFRQGDDAQALHYFQQALRADPSYSEATFGLGKFYLRTGRTQEAVVALTKAKAGLDQATEVHYWLGRALIKAGHKTEGGRELARAESLNQTQQSKMQEVPNGVPVQERQQTSFHP